MSGPDLTGKYRCLPSCPRERHKGSKTSHLSVYNQNAWDRMSASKLHDGARNAFIQTSVEKMDPRAMERILGIRLVYVVSGKFLLWGFVNLDDREKFLEHCAKHYPNFDGLLCNTKEVKYKLPALGQPWRNVSAHHEVIGESNPYEEYI